MTIGCADCRRRAEAQPSYHEPRPATPGVSFGIVRNRPRRPYPADRFRPAAGFPGTAGVVFASALDARGGSGYDIGHGAERARWVRVTICSESGQVREEAAIRDR